MTVDNKVLGKRLKRMLRNLKSDLKMIQSKIED